MMVVSLILVLNFSIVVSASSGYDRQEADTCITISQRLSVKGGSGKTITAGKNFKDHYVRHKGLLTKLTNKNYSKYKVDGQTFLDDEFVTILETGKGLDKAIQMLEQ